MSYAAYRGTLESRYWTYWEKVLGGRMAILREETTIGKGPPVFRGAFRDLNILIDERNPEAWEQVRREIPRASRHRWFGSFHSSQALAQSVFGNLKQSGKLELLDGLRDQDELPVFGSRSCRAEQMVMEFPVTRLGEIEGRSTEVDVRFGGEYTTCVECKFTEREVGSCSRPQLRRSDAGYKTYHCDGSFSHQRGRRTRCSLTEIGIRYWDYVPDILGWPTEVDVEPCPLRLTYQLVRNILAACVRSTGEIDLDSGHAVLVYDRRNPQFRKGGAGFRAWETLRNQLRRPSLLRRCSWQSLVSVLRQESELQWLTSGLEAKYGL